VAVSELTVIDVMRDLGLEPTPEVTWPVGAIVRDLYEQRYGCLPEKKLRPKTSGEGTHCFAVYPTSMRPEIEKVIRAHQTEAARQMVLF
jgi:hypothetical protein